MQSKVEYLKSKSLNTKIIGDSNVIYTIALFSQ